MKTIYKRILKQTLLLILTIHLSLMSFSATYYVSNSGNDANSGLTEALAWKTLAKVRGTSFAAGDIILLKSGDVWNEYFSLLSNGTVTNRILVSSYGTGEKPEIRGYGEISGWNVSGNWTQYSTGIWRMSLPTKCQRLWINGADRKESNTLSLDQEFPWRWESNYLYIKANTNPAIAFTSIINGLKQWNTFALTNRSNITIEKINLSGGNNTIKIENSKHITIDGCDVGYRTNSYGIFLSASNNDSIDNIIISNCLISSGDSLYYNYYRTIHTTGEGVWLGNGVINSKVFNNYFYGWSHAAVYMYNLSKSYPFHNNEVFNNYITAPLIDYSRGFCADYTSNGFNNSFHHNTIVNTSVRSQFNGNGLKFYDNIIDGVRGCPYPEKTNVGGGFAIEGYATPATNMEIYNNTIMNCADDAILITWYNTNEKSFNIIRNNNIFNNNPITNIQLKIYTNSSSVNNNSYLSNHFYSSKSNKVIYYYPSVLDVNGFNSKLTTNNDIISGNNAILKYGKYTTNVNDLRIEHNGTPIAKTISIDQPMVDSNGNKYLSSVTIPKYSSIILLKDPTIYSTEYKSICDGANYNGWTITGKYERTLTAKIGGDSIVTTYLTVNPKYSISEDVIINEGENYKGYTKTGKYTRNLTSVSGCDSIVVTNLTVVSSIIKQGSIAPSHFIPVWQGENGLNHINLMVVSATLEDLSLAANDEIAVFSGSKCVGSSKLTQGIVSTDQLTYLGISASQNDGTNNGFTDNDTIIFKIWDNQNQKEMMVKAVKYRNEVAGWLTSGKFVAGATAVVELVSYTEFTQAIELVKGYNMISTYLSIADPNVTTVTKSLVNTGALVKMQEESGKSYENWGSFGGWINNLGSIQKTEGYKIKVANNCTLQVTGRPIALPFDIPLKSGWNIISFPRTDFVDAMSIVGSLIDQNKLIKVQDEKGNSIENWGMFGGWKNGIGNFIPGKAYKVKMNADAILTIQEYYTKSAVIMAKNEETEHFSSDVEGNGSDHMNINLIGLTESGFSVGDELAAYDGDLCVGTLKLSENHLAQNSASLVASFSTDDQNKTGFKSGNRIQIYTWNQASGNESELQAEPVSGQMNYEKNASVWTKLKLATTGTKTGIEDLVSIDLFPNPSTGKVTVRFSTVPDAGSRIDVLDVSGRKIATRQITGTSEEFNLFQQPKGIYLVKTVLGTNELIKKLIIN